MTVSVNVPGDTSWNHYPAALKQMRSAVQDKTLNMVGPDNKNITFCQNKKHTLDSFNTRKSLLH